MNGSIVVLTFARNVPLGRIVAGLAATEARGFDCLEIIVVDDVVSTDRGPFHIAGALGRPATGLFRVSHPEHARRHSSISEVVAPDLVACHGRRSWDRCRWSPCRRMSPILPETALDAAQARLRGRSVA